MEKWLCWGTMGVAGLVLVLFVLDLVTGKFPFGGLNKVVDILATLSCVVVFYLGYDTFKEMR